jgi:hypothetical protein
LTQPRTTTQAVQDVLGRDYDADRAPSLKVRMETAKVVVDRVAVCALAKDVSYTAEELELIERWLAAHLYAVSDKPYASRSTLSASGSFAGQTGKGLEFTQYGQHAMLLDYAGCLIDLQNQAAASPAPAWPEAVAGGAWLGRPPSSQTDYEDRD